MLYFVVSAPVSRPKTQNPAVSNTTAAVSETARHSKPSAMSRSHRIAVTPAFQNEYDLIHASARRAAVT
jgi:hypothetical protein